MRVLAAIAFVVPVVVTVYVLSRGPWPEPRAQTAAIHAADSLTRARVAGPADGPRVERVVVGATRRGRMAWAAAELAGAPDATLGRRPSWHTVAYRKLDGEWRVLVEQRAQAPTWDELQVGAASRSFPAPAALAAPEGRAAGQLARRFRRIVEHYGLRRADRRAIAVGPAAGEPAFGDSAVKVMVADWERRLGEPRLLESGLSVTVPRRSGVGWVVANLEASPPGWGGATLPLRLTAVYRDRDEDDWGLVLVHLSVGDPGAGPIAAGAATIGRGR